MYILVFGFSLGAVLGSLIKALSDRSLNNKSFWGRSYCPNCKKKLQWYDLLPVLSYLFLRGNCRYCKEKIGIEYLIVEVITGILVSFLFWQSFLNFDLTILNLFSKLPSVEQSISNVFKFSIFLLELLAKTFFIVVMAILFLTDLKKMLIPDRIVLPSIVIGIILKLIITVSQIGFLFYVLSQSKLGRLLLPPQSDYFQRHVLLIAEPFLWSILTGVLIGGFFLSLIIITKGKGMGGGDVKLGAFLGLMLGFPGGLFALVVSFITGAVFSIGLIISGKKHFGQTIPFGPFLVLGSLAMLFWGDAIINWYLHIGT